MSQKFLYKIDCPICNNSRKKRDCRQAVDTGFIFCMGDIASAPGFQYIKEDRNGFKIWAESSDAQNPDWRNDLDKKTSDRKIEDQKIYNNSLSVEERDTEIRKFLALLTLKPEHIADLQRRGLTGEAIARIGFKSTPDRLQSFSTVSTKLPGLIWNHTYCGKQGYICPIFNIDGLIIGFQVRTDNPEESGKYVWTTSYSDGLQRTAHLPNGELPLTVATSGTEEHIGLIEGILKPQVAAFIHGGTYIGAAGGNFLSSQEQLESNLKNLSKKYNTKKVYFYPDSGCLLNPNVFKRDIRTINHLVSLGYGVRVADWGQLKDKSIGDWDEVQNPQINWLTPTEFINLSEVDSESIWNGIKARLVEFAEPKIKFNHKVKRFNQSAEFVEYIAGSLPIYDPENGLVLPKFIIDAPSLRKAFYTEAKAKGWNYVLDTSHTGSGKSWDAGNYSAHDFFEYEEGNYKIYHLTKSSRNPTTTTLEENFVELPARHNGFKLDFDKRTPLGQPQRTRAKKDDTEKTQSNCHFSDRFGTLSAKNRKVDLCGKCEFKFECKALQGNGYGFKSEIRQAMSNSLIRANLKGLSSDMVGDHCVGIVDEYSQSMEPYKTLIVEPHDIPLGLGDLRDIVELEKYTKVRDLFDELSRKITRDASGFGLSHADIIKVLGEAPEWLNEVLEDLEALKANNDDVFDLLKRAKGDEFDNSILKNWLVDFLSVWLGLADGSFSSYGNNLQILVRDNHLLDIIDSFGFLVFQDATGSTYDLANKISVNQSEILHCALIEPDKQNLDIINVTGLGVAGKRRSELCDSRINALVSHWKEEYGNDVGFIDWKDKAKPKWLTHFADARGSNSYQSKKAVASFGAPYPSLSALAAEYTLWTGECVNIKKPSDGFQRLIGERLTAEILQEIGRIRANRRQDEHLTYYLCADLDVTFLVNLGYRVTQKEAISITVEAGDRMQRTLYMINQALKELETPTLSGISKVIGKATSTISRAINKLGGLEKIAGYMEEVLFGERSLNLDLADAWIIESYIPILIKSEQEDFYQEVTLLDGDLTLSQLIAGASLQARSTLLTALLDLLPDEVLERLENFRRSNAV